MALQNVEANITLDLYNHDTTPATVKAIQLDSQTRYVAAMLRNVGMQYDVDSGATVQLIVVRPDNVGVQIAGETFEYGEEGAQFLGPYAELTQVALAVSGKMRGQFKITSGTQILRTEIFAINNGVALDASTDEWADEYDGYNLDELVADVAEAVEKVGDLETDVAQIKEELNTVALDNLSQREWVPTFTADRYIGVSDGKLHTSTKYTCTALWTGTGMRDAVAITGNTYELAVFFYGENGRIQSGDDYLGHSAYVSNGVIVYIPTSAVLIALTARRIDQEVLTDTDRTAIQEALVCYQSTAKKAESGLDTIVASKAIDKSGGTIKDVYIGYSIGKVQTSSQTVKTLCMTCAPNTVYKVSHPLSTQFVIASYTNEPVVNSIANKVYNGREEKETVFSTGTNAKWLGIYYYSSARNPDVTPEATYDALTIATIGFDELAETVSVLAKTEAQQEGTYGFYTSNETLELPTTFEGVIEMYDALVAERPDYVTKNVLTSGDVTNYEYVFTSGDYNRDPSAQRSPDAQVDKPVILLSSGVHGYERSAVISLYKLMRGMCSNDYALCDLINYVTIKVIPVGCPWGYTNNSRLNANGVNINRNFATSTWGDYDPGSPGSSEYAGPSAGSEDETKILQAWMTANSDALFYVDFHNSNFTNEVAQLSGSDETNSMVFKKRYLLGLNKIIPYWQKARGIDSANNYYCYTGGDGTNEGRVSRNYAYEAGIHLSFSHETSWNVNNSGKHSQTTLNVGAEVMGNFLIGMKDYYKEI